jgi:8-oxo-dGTP pyrophosphatase MutT (NUDIX family)
MTVRPKAVPSQPLVQQAAALPWRQGAVLEILLITSLDTGRWVLPKGRVEERESPHGAARREAMEEAGLEGDVGTQMLGTYMYEKRQPDGQRRPCCVTVFPMKVTAQREHWPERDRRKTKWLSIQEAANAVQEEDLRKLILAFDPRWKRVVPRAACRF